MLLSRFEQFFALRNEALKQFDPFRAHAAGPMRPMRHFGYKSLVIDDQVLDLFCKIRRPVEHDAVADAVFGQAARVAIEERKPAERTLVLVVAARLVDRPGTIGVMALESRREFGVVPRHYVRLIRDR